MVNKMKKIILIVLSIGLGIFCTFYIFNKEQIYAKEEYLVFAFQVGAYKDYDNAKNFSKTLPSSIIVQEDNLYKIYISIYKDIDIVNKMLVYFENNNINIYLKSLNVNKKYYNILSNYEEIIKNSDNIDLYNSVNQSILNLYIESINNEEFN